jgi:hypothetical protein
MRRIHNTASSKIDLTRTYGSSSHYKPHGLWYSIDDEWREWCQSGMPQWIKPNWFNLDLNMEGILVIQSVSDLLSFQKKYRILEPYPQISWESVKKDYRGIEIQNYYDLKRFFNSSAGGFMDYMWLYGWDINSGCIWDLSCVRSIQLINDQYE